MAGFRVWRGSCRAWRRDALDAATAAHPGMKSAAVYVKDAAKIRVFASKIEAKYPTLNILFSYAAV